MIENPHSYEVQSGLQKRYLRLHHYTSFTVPELLNFGHRYAFIFITSILSLLYSSSRLASTTTFQLQAKNTISSSKIIYLLRTLPAEKYYTMVYLTICRYLANHPPAIVVPIVINALAMLRMTQLVPFDEVPDLKFGFTPKQMHELMQEQWGQEGCQAYVDSAFLDLFPYMEAYAVIFGTLLILGARRQGWDEKVAFLGAITMIMDVGETVILRRACQLVVLVVVDEQPFLSDVWIQASSLFNQLKWVLFALSLFTIAAAFILPRRSISSNKKKITKTT